ncbi:MAG TPA: carboxypeptidase regulatory-like domain-containing protein [Candidatus Acidoferrum sp.]|nr:carboxypeptidase regulatory-like domain-containing protein [Candidatus Acidoferrum sp.]
MRQVIRSLPALVALSLVLILFQPFRAAGQNPTGAVRGSVEDSSGARVAGARVAIRGLTGLSAREVTADERGEFRVDFLPSDSYRVTVDAAGFATAQSAVSVAVGTVRDLLIMLHPAPVRQTLTVKQHASSITTEPIDTASAVQQAIVTAKDLETIPLANRSFANIAYLAPGTEPVEPSDPTKARITAVSFGGSSGLNVELSVDGGDNSDDYIGGFLQNFSPDGIQEFAVRTAQEDADTGRTTAGSVVITTKRGTDVWHGDAAFYERAAALNARYPIENPSPDPKQPFSRQNYVGTLGGPIRPGKLWFFSSLEYVHEDASIAYSPATQMQFAALAQLAEMGLVPKVDSIDVPQNVRVPFRDYLATIRTDWAQSARSQWFLRAAADNYTTENDLVQQATLPSTGATSHSNYLNLLINQQFTFSSTWLGSFTFDAGGLHHTEARNSSLGYALAFPFSATSQTISGFETFGDNQFVTAITAFPVLRNQEKYQFRYDVRRTSGRHATSFGVNFIHEPVLDGALTGTEETLFTYPEDPSFYVANPSQFYSDLTCTSPTPADVTCTASPASDGSFAQNVQRLGLYAQDSWRAKPNLTLNYGLRWDTTIGLFDASGRSQLENPALLTVRALGIPLVSGSPHDYRKQFAPRIGFAYTPESSQDTVIRGGFGLFFNDLAQNGWVSALQAVNAPPLPCVVPSDPGCIPPGGAGALIDPRYRTPYAIHFTAGMQHAFNDKWIVSTDYAHEQGVHGYRRYEYVAGFTLPGDAPDVSLFRSDNRSSYNALMVRLQGNVSRRFNLVANYTLSSAKTWGCVLGELFDYVNGVCNPNDAFAHGDYGPSGEDARHRFVLAGTVYSPGGFELTTLSQFESARPYTLTTPLDVNGFGDSAGDRAIVNGVQTSLDGLRGAPYIQVDLRVSRPFRFRDRWTATPFIEFFNLFNRSNPGENFVTDISALPVPVNDLSNVTALCPTPACNVSIKSLRQLRAPAGALGDFFGPGTTVGIPLAAQVGFRLMF